MSDNEKSGPTAAKIPSKIDNDLYNHSSESWWSDRGFGALLRNLSNPWRMPYFQRILLQHLGSGSQAWRLLDVGCGGGILAEEFAAMGFAVTGIDPSSKSLEVARAHAAQRSLSIDYCIGSGDALPFENETFEVVICCDVLEHIPNWDGVLGEIARVLKHQGLFMFDTINRTTASKIFLIKMAQEWKFTRFLPSNLHVWEMFITPEELKASLAKHGLQYKEIRGTKPNGNLVQMVIDIRQYNAGKLSAAEFGKRFGPQEGSNVDGFYMGYALKP